MQKIILVLGLFVLMGAPLTQALDRNSAANTTFDNAQESRESFESLLNNENQANILRRARYRKLQAARESRLLAPQENTRKRLSNAQRIKAIRQQRRQREDTANAITTQLEALRAKLAEQAVIDDTPEVDPSIFDPFPAAALKRAEEKAAKSRAALRMRRQLQRIRDGRTGRFSRSGPSQFKRLRQESFKRSIRER